MHGNPLDPQSLRPLVVERASRGRIAEACGTSRPRSCGRDHGRHDVRHPTPARLRAPPACSGSSDGRTNAVVRPWPGRRNRMDANRGIHGRHLAMTAAVLTVVVVAFPQRASAAPACVPGGADVVAESGPLAVYSGSGTRLIACRDSASGVRRRTVGSTSFCEDGADCEADRVFAVTGSCVAVQSYKTDRYHNDSWSLVAWDVRQTRGWTYGLRLTPPSGPPRSERLTPTAAASKLAAPTSTLRAFADQAPRSRGPRRARYAPRH